MNRFARLVTEHHRSVSVGLEVDANVELDRLVVQMLDTGRRAGHGDFLNDHRLDPQLQTI